METSRYQVVVISGGKGERLWHRTRGKVPKALLYVAGKTLLQRCIELFSASGLRDFRFLLGYGSEQIKKFVGSGKKFQISAIYSIEKNKLGKAGALKLALKAGVIDRKRPAIITYPDDLIFLKDFPKKAVEAHEKGVKKGCIATVVRVAETQHRYGLVEVKEGGIVKRFDEKPVLSISASTGIYIFEPKVWHLIEMLKRAPVDFEDTILPKLVKQGKLFAFTIPLKSWIPVNEEKEFQLAERLLARK